MADQKQGFLSVGIDPNLREVVINLDHDRTGHITFSPEQARQLAATLVKKASEADHNTFADDDVITREWLESHGFLQDGDNVASVEFGRRLWQEDDDETDDYKMASQCPGVLHWHLLINVPERAAHVEAYDLDGKSVAIFSVPGSVTRSRVLELLNLSRS